MLLKELVYALYDQESQGRDEHEKEKKGKHKTQIELLRRKIYEIKNTLHKITIN
jgi:hypothetical protein